MNLKPIYAKMATIQERYNGDNDTPPGPLVTWTDDKLLEIIRDLIQQVSFLEDRIEDIEARQLNNALDNLPRNE